VRVAIAGALGRRVKVSRSCESWVAWRRAVRDSLPVENGLEEAEDDRDGADGQRVAFFTIAASGTIAEASSRPHLEEGGEEEEVDIQVLRRVIGLLRRQAASASDRVGEVNHTSASTISSGSAATTSMSLASVCIFNQTVESRDAVRPQSSCS